MVKEGRRLSNIHVKRCTKFMSSKVLFDITDSFAEIFFFAMHIPTAPLHVLWLDCVQ